VRYRFEVLSTATLVIGLIGHASAQQCSTRTTAGKYAVTCDGFLTPAPGAPLVPAKILSVATADRKGNFTASGTISIGGTILQQEVTGTEQLNPDCTGTITYEQTIGGQPGPPLDITFFVSQDGNIIDGLVVDPGTALACKLTRTKDCRTMDERELAK
jgi:hypothetical protein